MCRNIRNLYNFQPPAEDSEIHAAALQFVRKITGFQKPSQVNEQAFHHAVADIATTAAHLLASLHTQAPPKSRQEEIAKARARNAIRFGGPNRV